MHPTQPTLRPTDRERWRSIVISLAIQFSIQVQNAMFFSNLWPFMKQIDPTTSQSFYGLALMAASLCVAVASPLFGYWANRVQQCKTPLYFGISMIVLGNLLVGITESFPADRKYVLMVGRMLTGVGSGCYAPLFAYIVMATRVDERRTAVSLRAAFATVSNMIGPALASIFVPIGFPGIVIGNFLHLDMYSTIAWVNIGVCALLFFVVRGPFKEYWIGVDASQLRCQKTQTQKVSPIREIHYVSTGKLWSTPNQGKLSPEAIPADSRPQALVHSSSTSSTTKGSGTTSSSKLTPLQPDDSNEEDVISGTSSGGGHLKPYDKVPLQKSSRTTTSYHKITPTQPDASDEEDGTLSMSSGGRQLKPYDKVPLLVCFYIRFVYMFMMAIERSIGTAFMMIMFRWSPAEVISYNAIIQLATGVVDFGGNLVMGTIILKYVKERSAMVAGLAVSLGYFLFNFPWPGMTPIEVPEFFHFNIGDNISFPLFIDTGDTGILTNQYQFSNSNFSIANSSNLTSSHWVSPLFDLSSSSPIGNYSVELPSTIFANSTEAFTMNSSTIAAHAVTTIMSELTGCVYAWCSYTSKVSLWKYVTGRVFLILSLSMGFTPASTLVAKVLGPRKQGTIQGLFSASGQLGLTICPLIMGTTFQYLGPRVAFAIGAAVNLSGLILVGLTFRRLVGWQELDHSEQKIKDMEEATISSEKAPLLGPLSHKKSKSYVN